MVAGAGRVGCALVRELVLRGFGADAPFSIVLLATRRTIEDASFLVDELGDVLVKTLVRLELTTSVAEAFEGCDAAVFAASGPLVGRGSREELFASNAEIITNLTSSALRYGRNDIKIAIVSNPVNALVGHVIRHSDCDPSQVSGVVSIDLARARSVLRRRLGSDVSRSASIEVWGNHSSNVAVSVSSPLVPPGLIEEVDRYLAERGPTLLSVHGRTAIDSAAVSAHEHLRFWLLGTEGTLPFAASVLSPDAPLGFDDLPYTMPVISDGLRWAPLQSVSPLCPRVHAAMLAARLEIVQVWRQLDSHSLGAF